MLNIGCVMTALAKGQQLSFLSSIELTRVSLFQLINCKKLILKISFEKKINTISHMKGFITVQARGSEELIQTWINNILQQQQQEQQQRQQKQQQQQQKHFYIFYNIFPIFHLSHKIIPHFFDVLKVLIYNQITNI